MADRLQAEVAITGGSRFCGMQRFAEAAASPSEKTLDVGWAI